MMHARALPNPYATDPVVEPSRPRRGASLALAGLVGLPLLIGGAAQADAAEIPRSILDVFPDDDQADQLVPQACTGSGSCSYTTKAKQVQGGIATGVVVRYKNRTGTWPEWQSGGYVWPAGPPDQDLLPGFSYEDTFGPLPVATTSPPASMGPAPVPALPEPGAGEQGSWAGNAEDPPSGTPVPGDGAMGGPDAPAQEAEQLPVGGSGDGSFPEDAVLVDGGETASAAEDQFVVEDQVVVDEQFVADGAEPLLDGGPAWWDVTVIAPDTSSETPDPSGAADDDGVVTVAG